MSLGQMIYQIAVRFGHRCLWLNIFCGDVQVTKTSPDQTGKIDPDTITIKPQVAAGNTWQDKY